MSSVEGGTSSSSTPSCLNKHTICFNCSSLYNFNKVQTQESCICAHIVRLWLHPWKSLYLVKSQRASMGWRVGWANITMWVQREDSAWVYEHKGKFQKHQSRTTVIFQTNWGRWKHMFHFLELEDFLFYQVKSLGHHTVCVIIQTSAQRRTLHPNQKVYSWSLFQLKYRFWRQRFRVLSLALLTLCLSILFNSRYITDPAKSKTDSWANVYRDGRTF